MVRQPLSRAATLAMLLVLAMVTASTAATPYPGPPLPGSTFTFSEDYAASFDIAGTANGNLAIDATTTFTVIDRRQYTQQCPSLPGDTYDVVYIEWSGTADVTGTGSVPQFFLNNVPIRILNARFDGKLWLRASDLATVAKKREIEGDAEIDLVGIGQWLRAATARANQFEEYILPLEDFRWPLDPAAAPYEQKPSICAYGDFNASVDVAGLISEELGDTFDTVLDLNFSVSVPGTGQETINGQTYDYTISEEFSPDFGATQTFWYAPALRYIIRQEISQLSVAGLIDLQQVTFEATDVNVPVAAGADLRVAHLSYDAPAVDIYANGALTPASNIPFETSTDFINVPAGTYDFDVVPTGGTLADSVKNVPGVPLADNTSYTVAAFGSTMNANGIDVLALADDFSDPGAGNIRVRAIHAADGIGQVDIWNISDPSNPTPLFVDLDYATDSAYAVIPAGGYDVGIDADDDGVVDFSFMLPSLPEGTVANIFASVDMMGMPFLFVNTNDGAAGGTRINPLPTVTEAELRVLHLSANAPAVDIYANGAVTPATNVAFQGFTPFVSVPADTYDFDVVPAGGSLGDSVYTEAGVPLEAGKTYSATAIGDLANNTFSILALEEDLSGTMPGNIRIRAVHAADQVGQVDIWNITDPNNPSQLYENVDFGVAGAYTEIPAGQYTIGLDVNDDAVPDVVFELPDLAEGTVATLFAGNEADGSVFLAAALQNGDVAIITPVGGAAGGVEITADFPVDRILDVDLRVFVGDAELPVQLYVVLEVGGVFLYYPTFSEAPVEVVTVTLPANFDSGFFDLYNLPIPLPIGSRVTLNWYAALINTDDGSVVGDVAFDSAEVD